MLRLAIVRCLLFTVVALASSCISIGLNPERTGIIYLDEAVMAKGADAQSHPIDPTTLFRSADQKIWCTISVRGPKGVRLGARWYYGSNLIGEQWITVDKNGRGAWWLEVPPSKKFPVGDYHIEIFLIKDPMKVVHFKVVE